MLTRKPLIINYVCLLKRQSFNLYLNFQLKVFFLLFAFYFYYQKCQMCL